MELMFVAIVCPMPPPPPTPNPYGQKSAEYEADVRYNSQAGILLAGIASATFIGFALVVVYAIYLFVC
jgi:tetrahydromethanopterin S-methyltransferase subunit F